MTHSDDDGLVLPPRLAPIQVVIVPIPKPLPEIIEVAETLEKELKAKGIRVKIDRDEKKRPGFKFAEYELLGVPIRLGLGKRDMEKGVIEVARRDTKEKTSQPMTGIAAYIEDLLNEIQDSLLQRAKDFRSDHTTSVDTFDEFKEVINGKGGFVSAHWDGTTETELKIKELTKATIRCIPIDRKEEQGNCILTGQPSEGRVLFAKAY